MNFSRINAQSVYEIIRDSIEIQELIKSIVRNENEETSVSMAGMEKNGCSDFRDYNIKEQLQREVAELRKYKDYYEEAIPKLERYDSLNDEVSYLRQTEKQVEYDLKQEKSEIEKLNNKIEKLNNIIFNIKCEKNELLSEIDTVKNENENLKKHFEAPVKYFELYRSLSDKVKNGLENVVKDTNEISFIVSCTDENNLSAIWEYIREISNDVENEDYQKLSEIFDYCFEIFNQSLPEAKYERDDVEAGDEFDGDYYDRFFGSSTSGEITRVILRGYKSINTGKSIHKSLVML